MVKNLFNGKTYQAILSYGPNYISTFEFTIKVLMMMNFAPLTVATIAVLKLCTDALVKLEVELDNFISDDGIDEVNN